MRNKTLINILLFGIITFMLSGCKKPNETTLLENMKLTDIAFFGDKWLTEEHKGKITNFGVTINSPEFTYDENNVITGGTGIMIYVVFYKEGSIKTIPTGNFPCFDGTKANTFAKGKWTQPLINHGIKDSVIDASFYYVIKNGKQVGKAILITDGDMSISKQGDEYVVEFATTMDSKPRKFTAKGKEKDFLFLNMAYPQEPFEATTNTLNITKSIQALCSKSQNLFSVVLGEEATNTFQFFVYGQENNTDFTELPRGTFPVLSSHKPNTAVAGDAYGGIRGTLVTKKTQEKLAIWYMQSGNIIIEYSNSNYKISFNGLSAMGSTFNVIYNGAINIKIED